MTAVGVGTALPDHRVTVSAEAMKPVALLLRDPNPIHLDPAVVAALGFGERVINQGPLNASYVWEMLSRWLGGTDRVRVLDLRYTSNAFAEEELVAGGCVEEVDDRTGQIRCSVWLRHADGTDVVRGRAVVDADEKESPR